MIRVFLSSTSKDLSECRSLAYHAIEGLTGYHCVRMEDFGSWDTQPDALCRRRVLECDLFVLIAGPLYGSYAPNGKSYTESEYDAAEESKKPRLIFLTTDDFAIPAKLAEPMSKRKRQDAFRKRLLKDRVVSMFTNGAELAPKVLQAIHHWQALPQESSVIRVSFDKPQDAPSIEFRRPYLRVGRSPEAEVFIDGDPDVSWEHGIIIKTGGQFFYQHLSAINPTMLESENRQTLLKPGESQQMPLESYNRIKVGNTVLTVEVENSTGPTKKVSTNKRPDE